MRLKVVSVISDEASMVVSGADVGGSEGGARRTSVGEKASARKRTGQ
jgi:hypothetical protein